MAPLSNEAGVLAISTAGEERVGQDSMVMDERIWYGLVSILLVMVTISATVFLCACGKNEEKEEAPPQPPEEPPPDMAKSAILATSMIQQDGSLRGGTGGSLRGSVQAKSQVSKVSKSSSLSGKLSHLSNKLPVLPTVKTFKLKKKAGSNASLRTKSQMSSSSLGKSQPTSGGTSGSIGIAGKNGSLKSGSLQKPSTVSNLSIGGSAGSTRTDSKKKSGLGPGIGGGSASTGSTRTDSKKKTNSGLTGSVRTESKKSNSGLTGSMRSDAKKSNSGLTGSTRTGSTRTDSKKTNSGLSAGGSIGSTRASPKVAK